MPNLVAMAQGFVHNQIVELEPIASSNSFHGQTHKHEDNTPDTSSSLPTAPILTNTTSNPRLNRQIYDMRNISTSTGRNEEAYKLLPGNLVRSEGEPPILDNHANQAYDNCGIVFDFFHQVFDYTFLDLDPSTPIISSIHFGNAFQNAQWTGEKCQMVYGDGGRDLYNFTACLDIIAHEMAVSTSSPTHCIDESCDY